MDIATERKGTYVIHSSRVPNPIDATLVRIDVGCEERYRIRLPDGTFGGRMNVSHDAHHQDEKMHEDVGLYILLRGWVAILVRNNGSITVDVGFAHRCDGFYVKAPAKTWYIAYLSRSAVHTYASSNNRTGIIRHSPQELLSEDEILKMYSEQHRLPYNDVLRWASQSLV